MALGGSSADLNVRVDGDVDPYERAVQRAQRATSSWERSIESVNRDLMLLEKEVNDQVTKRIEAQHQAFTKVGRGMVIAGAGLLAGAALATKAAMDWETAWTGVEKVVEGTPEQMGQLEDSLRSLALRLPATHEEIAGVAAAAGQLGVAREDIAGFTETMIKLGTTTNLSSDQAATSLARFMNIMQTAPDDVDRLGATIVDLGNKGASTESEITEMGLRIAGAGHQVGLTEAEVLAVANALSSLGLEAEAGGSAISRTLINISQATATGSGKLETYAKTAGMTVDQFSRLEQTDPAAALAAFTQGLGKMKESGGNVLQTLEDLGITEIRQRDAILRLAGSGDVLTQSLNDGSTAWEENSALVDEAAKRYETTEAKVQIARNTLYDAAITIGESLLPVLASTAEFIAGVARAFGDLPGPVKSLIGPMIALAGVATLVGGAFLMAVPKIAAFNAAMASGNLTAGMQRMGTAVKGTAAFLTGPWGAALGIGVTALGIFAAKHGEAAAEVDALKATLDEQTGALTENSRQWAIKKLSDSGALDSAKTLGINLGTLTAAALGNADAISQVNDQLATFQTFAVGTGRGASVTGGGGEADDVQKINDLLGTTNSTLDESRTKWQLEHEAASGAGAAMGETGDQAQTAAGKQGELATQSGEAASAMAEEKSTAEQLTDALDALNGVILGARAGARSYQETIDASNKTLREGIKTVNIHTKAGRENQAALDDVANATMSWAEDLAKVDETGRRSNAVMRQGRKDLMAMAEQFFGSKKAARDYVNEVLQIPTDWHTDFTTPGATQSKHNADEVRVALEKIPQKVGTTVTAETSAARSAVAGFAAAVNSILGGIQDETVNVSIFTHRSTIKEGQANPPKAAGGRILGRGGPREDNQLTPTSAGEHVWTTREVLGAGGHGAVEELRRRALSGEIGSAGGNGRTSVVTLPAAAQSGPQRISGTLDIPGFGPAYIRGVVLDEMESADHWGEAQAGRSRR